jgi:hypothetical protein
VSRHTPGPWRLEKWVGEYHVRRPAPKGMPTELSMRMAALELARVPADHSDASDECHTNARLIAAAPELLHHLRILAEEDSQCASDWVKKKEAARALITKVEGGT